MHVSTKMLSTKGESSKILIVLALLFLAPSFLRAQEELLYEPDEELYAEPSDFYFERDDHYQTPEAAAHGEEENEYLEAYRKVMEDQVTEDDDRNWWHLLKKGKLNLSDTTVVYPKFLRFCVNVYNWADRTFNSYNPDYVVGTGHRWKARIVNENWTDSYDLRIKKSKTNIRMLSHLNDNIGAYIQYMAVSVGYSVDLNTVFGGRKADHSRFETNFNCALFNADLYYYKSNGTYIRHFTGFSDHHLIRSLFPGVDCSNFGISAYYFLNNKKYSQGAAYNFSKYQKKSAGSWMFGLTYSNLDISMDFRELAPELKPFFKFPTDYLHLHYFSYTFLFGYGFNWVWHPKWVFNISVMPSIGFNHCYEDSSEGSGEQLALDIHARTALTYNHRALFCSLIGKITGNWYTSQNLSLFNAIEYFSLNIGFRF